MKKMLALIVLMLAAPTWGQAVYPQSGSSTRSLLPTITVVYGAPVDDVRIWIDDTEYSDQARHSGRTVSLKPPAPLADGIHEVRVSSSAGELSWQFRSDYWCQPAALAPEDPLTLGSGPDARESSSPSTTGHPSENDLSP